MKTTQLLRRITVGALAFVAVAASAQTPAVAPAITNPPASLLLNAGADATFTVAATGFRRALDLAHVGPEQAYLTRMLQRCEAAE